MQTASFAGLTFVQTYRYDSLYRITEARETNGPATNASQNWKEMFDCDRFGNRTTFTKFTGTTQLALDNKTFPSIDPDTNRFNSFLRKLESEAIGASANQISITGTNIRNSAFLQPSMVNRAARLGFGFEKVSPSTIRFTKKLF
ncbi:MAG: hypothetical protein IPJ30_09815 [Acidobacteria bacterium]|nr:hypothetical protein [Acidobacteriota bacterium]